MAVPPHPERGDAATRFRDLDGYRVEREWARYEGNPLRDLFRELRARFVARHCARRGKVLDVGAGPGRFTRSLARDEARPVLFDISLEMLRRARGTLQAESGGTVDLVHGDAGSPPFAPRAFSLVAALGNVVGYMPSFGWPSMEPLASLVAPSGQLVLEFVPGFGERSAYFARLPPGAVARVLRSPASWVLGRVNRGGFTQVPHRTLSEHGFRRLPPSLILNSPPAGWRVEETMAVAPALGFDMERLAATRGDPKAWERLLWLEEELGHTPERWPNAAALVVALSGPPD